MKPACGFFLLAFLLSLSVAFGQDENSSVLDKKISLEIKNEPVAFVLEQISLQARVFFSYDATLIGADRMTYISITNKTIRETLDVLLDSKFIYKVLGDQIIITLPVTEASKISEADSVNNPKRIILFKGKVVDRDERKVLPYTSISVLKRNIGSVSNTDGEFELKIPGTMRHDTVSFSCLGYRQFRQPIGEIRNESYTIYLQPTSIQLKEFKVTGISEQDIISKFLSKITLNYPHDAEIMTSFYREVLKQDNKYIDVAEALMEIRKAPYENTYTQDKVKFIKGRKSIDANTFRSVDFKIQGGPVYITQLDVVKTLDSFLDPEFSNFYNYSLNEIVEFDNRETYIIKFKPKEKDDYPCYQGKLFVDMASFALVQAEFSLSRSGLKFARESLIKKKPKDFYVRPLNADYKVSYHRSNNKWHFSNASASISFRVKSQKDKINSTFHSISELLVTNLRPDDGTPFKRPELINQKDIFTEIITTYDEDFWGDYNTIKPSEDLRNALRKTYPENDSLLKINEDDQTIIKRN